LASDKSEDAAAAKAEVKPKVAAKADGAKEMQVQLDELRAENAALMLKIMTLASPDAELSFSEAQMETALAAAVTAPASVIKKIFPERVILPKRPKRDMALKQGELLTPASEADIVWPIPGEMPPFWDRPPMPTPPASTDAIPQDPNPLHIVHITAEMAPIAKVGGLGDVVTGLARAHHCAGHNVEVILPYYSCLPDNQIQDLKHVQDFSVPKGTNWDGETRVVGLRTSCYSGVIGGCKVLLLRPTDSKSSNIFKGGAIYGGSYNELEAYLYFCRASLEFLKISRRQPDIIHVHEWQCSSVAMLYWDLYFKEGVLKSPKVMLTIHNMDNTGECRQEEFLATGVEGELFNTLERAMDERTIGHNPERMCLLKGGINYSNFVTTVSPTYAKDALEGRGGFLAKILKENKLKFRGVLNGVDEDLWDARIDPALPASFQPGEMAGKALCKKYLQTGLGLTVDADRPMVVCISRLVPQKGIDLIKHAIIRTKAKGGQFVLLGSGHSDPEFKKLAEGEYKDDPDVKLLVFYSDPLSHLMYAAADMVLVPSMFEPCGLTQMIAMQYGALPVVRKTGGLGDTVKDVDDLKEPEEKRNGFVFEGADNASLEGALDRAIEYYKERKEWWSVMQEIVMVMDNSWEHAGKEYMDLYRAMQLA